MVKLIERWVDVIGFSGLYKVSSIGRVLSISRKVKNTEKSTYMTKTKYLVGHKNKKGYVVYSLRKDNKYFSLYLHRIVATAFIPNPYNLKSVNHIDGNKDNNGVSNLEWLSLRDNSLEGIKMGLIKVSGEFKGTSKLKIHDVIAMRRLSATGLKAKAIAKMFCVSENCAYSVITKRAWKNIQ